MTYGFVRQSDGAVRIDSEEGKGTTIEICLPRYKGDAARKHQTSRRIAIIRLPVMRSSLSWKTRLLCPTFDRRRPQQYGLSSSPEAADGVLALRILQSSQRISIFWSAMLAFPELNGRQLADAARVNRPSP